MRELRNGGLSGGVFFLSGDSVHRATRVANEGKKEKRKNKEKKCCHRGASDRKQRRFV